MQVCLSKHYVQVIRWKLRIQWPADRDERRCRLIAGPGSPAQPWRTTAAPTAAINAIRWSFARDVGQPLWSYVVDKGCMGHYVCCFTSASQPTLHDQDDTNDDTLVVAQTFRLVEKDGDAS